MAWARTLSVNEEIKITVPKGKEQTHCPGCGRSSVIRRKSTWFTEEFDCGYCAAAWQVVHRKDNTKGFLQPEIISREFTLRVTNSNASWSKNWRKVRSEAIAKAGSQCEHCSSPDSLQVHHILPVAKGGKDDLENLIVLCSGCHTLAHSAAGLPHPRLTKGGCCGAAALIPTAFVLISVLIAYRLRGMFLRTQT